MFFRGPARNLVCFLIIACSLASAFAVYGQAGSAEHCCETEPRHVPASDASCGSPYCACLSCAVVEFTNAAALSRALPVKAGFIHLSGGFPLPGSPCSIEYPPESRS